MNNEAAAQLLQVLEKTISPDQNELVAAQHFLEEASKSNFPELLKSLSDILVHGGNSNVARRQSALQLKNFLSSNDEATRHIYQQRWLALPEDVRGYIKTNVVGALGSETYRPSAAAQCVQYIAVFELPNALWPTLIQVLLENVTNVNSTEMRKEATLEAIGYICSDIDHRCLEEKSNEILTAIVHGMKKDEPSNHVRLAATNALQNSLEFTRANFEKDAERHFIMQVVCEATVTTDVKVKVAALQCLVKIMSLYYQYMESYMGPALFAITLEAMKSDEDEVALQGIEFWSNVCDEEINLEIEAKEADEMGRPPERVSRFYSKGALTYIVPILMQSLAKQEEYDDEDDWNPSKAAGVCLMLLANCTCNDIVQHVLPFVQEHIRNTDWRFRDAALMSFGAILEGPDANALRPLVDQAMPMLIEAMNDKSVVVKDTAAWTIGRVCESNPEAAMTEVILRPLLEALVQGLESEPRVASNVCWAFNSLAEAAYEAAEAAAAGTNGFDGMGGNDDGTPQTYALSPFFEPIVQKLLAATDRADASNANLRAAAYEALMEMIKNSPKDCYQTVQKTVMVILERLQQVLQMESRISSQTERNQYNDLQSLLCATLQSVLKKVESEHAPLISDSIMQALLSMFQSSVNNKAGNVQEDALEAVATLVEVLGADFIKYMEAFKPFLHVGLRNVAEYQVCAAAVGVVGDICRALAQQFTPYANEIMAILLENLSNNNVHRQVKPQILSVFGDVALGIGLEFKPFLEMVLQTLAQASSLTCPDKEDFDMVEYIIELREACLDAYSGVLNGLKGGNESVSNPDLAGILPHVGFMINFIAVIQADEEKSDALINSAVGLIGDLCKSFGIQILPLVDVEAINELLTAGRRSRHTKTKNLSQWATREVRKLKNQVNTTT